MTSYAEAFADGREQGRKDCEKKIWALKWWLRTIIEADDNLKAALKLFAYEIRARKR